MSILITKTTNVEYFNNVAELFNNFTTTGCTAVASNDDTYFSSVMVDINGHTIGLFYNDDHMLVLNSTDDEYDTFDLATFNPKNLDSNAAAKAIENAIHNL